MGCGGSTQGGDRTDEDDRTRHSSVALNSKEAIIVGFLRKVPVLTKLNNRQRKQLAKTMKEVTYKAKDVVFGEGDAGDAFFIIMKGKVKVVRGDVVLAHLMTGDYFGETALLTDAPRGASIVALEPLETLMLDKVTFNKMFGDEANVKLVKRMAISAEVKHDHNNGKESSDSPLAPANAVREKSTRVRDLIYDAIKDSVLFSNFNRAHKYQVIEAMYRQPVKAGVAPIKEGEHGCNLFVIEEGEFEETCTGNDESVMKGPGELFGAKALMYSTPRGETVTAAVDSVVWKVDRYTFRRIGMNHGMAELEQSVGFLNQVDLLGGLTSAERAKVAEALETVEFPSNHVIFREGEVGDAMYIVSSGECICTKVPTSKAKQLYPNKPIHDESKDIIVATLKKTGVFGERALLKEEARAATVRTIIPTVCLRIDKESFQLLLGPLTDIMASKAETYEQKDDTEEENEAEGNQMEDISFKSLKHVGMLGQGSFGTVRLVQHNDTNKTYALKGVSKHSIVENNQQEHIMSEKRVMMRFNHPFLVRLYATYNKKDLLHFLLEPVLGGELFTLLRNKHMFAENESIFYAGCVVLAFEYMHMKGTVYRDLKPENLLVDADGYIQVTDFGFAKRIGDGQTWTLCGTPDYLCPEIVSGSGHGKGADWWTVGVLIYEMLTGRTPFYANDQMDMFENIVRAEVRFPSSMSSEAKSLIGGLLARKPTQRLGVTRGKSKGIKAHDWWKKSKVFDWDKLYHKQIVSPYKPKIKNNMDLRNFDQMEPEMPVARYHASKSNPNWDSDF